jgi:hypothetical protein
VVTCVSRFSCLHGRCGIDRRLGIGRHSQGAYLQAGARPPRKATPERRCAAFGRGDERAAAFCGPPGQVPFARPGAADYPTRGVGPSVHTRVHKVTLHVLMKYILGAKNLSVSLIHISYELGAVIRRGSKIVNFPFFICLPIAWIFVCSRRRYNLIIRA